MDNMPLMMDSRYKMYNIHIYIYKYTTFHPQSIDMGSIAGQES